MRVSIVSDAWFPQVNGVVTTLSTVGKELVEMGHQVQVVSPERFKTIPCPTYPEIRLAVGAGRRLEAYPGLGASRLPFTSRLKVHWVLPPGATV